MFNAHDFRIGYEGGATVIHPLNKRATRYLNQNGFRYGGAWSPGGLFRLPQDWGDILSAQMAADGFRPA